LRAGQFLNWRWLKGNSAMMFATARRWFGLYQRPRGNTVEVELGCGGRISLQDYDGNVVLEVTAAPDDRGVVHTVQVPLSVAERAELRRALGVGDPITE
jgi:hypothetical protein